MKMQVTSLLLLAATTAIATAQSQECFNGQLHDDILTDAGIPTILLEYCYNGEWIRICSTMNQLVTDELMAACALLGYSDSGEITTMKSICQAQAPLKVVILSDCNRTGLTECTVTLSDNCATTCFLVNLGECNTANCTDGALRLVGGSTDREGRVEVCVNGTQWRTVCTGSQELAGAVCSQMGYIFEGSSVAALNSFPRGAFPEYRLDCTGRGGECTAVKAKCTNSFMGLGVACEDVLITTTQQGSPDPGGILTPDAPTKETLITPVACTTTDGSSDNSTTYIAGIGVLVALFLAVSVGWIVSCVILLKKTNSRASLQHIDPAILTRSNHSYTQQDINEQLYDEAKAPDQTYSRLNGGQAQDYKMDDIATYDYADHNQIRAEGSQATNPPPLSDETIVTEEEFYNAEDHMYAAVNKKAKKKKTKNSEGERKNSSV